MARIVQRVKLAEVDIKPGGPKPPKPPVPSVIKEFLEEHKRLKAIIDKYGKRGMCVTRSTLEKDSGVKGERLEKHIRDFISSDVLSSVTEKGEEVLCGKESIREFKKRLEVEL